MYVCEHVCIVLRVCVCVRTHAYVGAQLYLQVQVCVLELHTTHLLSDDLNQTRRQFYLIYVSQWIYIFPYRTGSDTCGFALYRFKHISATGYTELSILVSFLSPHESQKQALFTHTDSR